MGNSSSSRVTLQQIADVCGVSRNTVSCALRGQGRLSAKTRERIQKTAEEMGYQQDARIRELTTYLATRKRAPDIQEELGYVWVPAKEGDTGNRYDFHLQELKTQAAEKGFHIEAIPLGQWGLSAEKVESILYARGIRGIFLTPIHLHPFPYPLNWERYSCLAFGHYFKDPSLRSIGFSFYRSVFTCFRNLHHLGYRRIGVIASLTYDKHLDYVIRGAAGAVVSMLPMENQVPILDSHSLGDTALRGGLIRTWLEDHQPDAVICGDQDFELFQQLGKKVPEELGVASYRKSPVHPNDAISGVEFDPKIFTAQALEWMIAMLNQSVRGVPQVPIYTQVEGTWFEGQTVRAVGEPVVLTGFDNHGP